MPYGNIIASRWPLMPLSCDIHRKELPWPQALSQVSVTVNGRSIVVITVHIPNGAGYGWHKIDTFLVLKNLVQRAKGRPCIVTGDFNEPQSEMRNGHILTWGQEPGGSSFWPVYENPIGRTGTGREWDAAVRWIFEKSALRHAYWEAHGHGAMDVSHVSRGQKRWIDHMFVSDGFHVEQCEYLHKLRGPGCSDHSALYASLTFDGFSKGKGANES
jgi:endonuclease/exonuclease/phosphatase family metal-dependent hydrolase